jgi:hypothetical protein
MQGGIQRNFTTVGNQDRGQRVNRFILGERGGGIPSARMSIDDGRGGMHESTKVTGTPKSWTDR